jgi:hypothetical protein
MLRPSREQPLDAVQYALAHCAKPKPFIDPGMSISLNTTSTEVLVFCRIVMASSVLAASTT